MSMTYSLREIVGKLGGEVAGPDDVLISRVASLANAQAGHISFLTDSKYQSVLAVTKASAVILKQEHRAGTDLPCIMTDNPYAYFARVSELLNPVPAYQPGINASAVIDASAKIPASCTIMANVVIAAGVVLGEKVVVHAGTVIGEGVQIGDHCVLQANVTIYHHCQIGNRCNIFSGSVIGGDGFGYAPDNGRWVKIPQVGRVIIEDDVDIGANTSIDRGALDDTIIEQGTKIDNLVQIGHNCRIGAHSVIAGCVGIAGSAILGKHCRIGGAAMILGHLEIADGVTVSPGSMITRSLNKADTYTALMPFQAHDDWLKTAAGIRRLGDLADRVKQLEKQLSTLQPVLLDSKLADQASKQ
ncbi:UDP-3-O-(3-hydroxymyristoyl)glucosamine N-acyltransferase [Methylobacillus gramineus]|uniref:UDP-3-O-(3-hydroxymyristoyl)glucosamine N-acyltransferase n=1 Tax=Methylobacillus gramineus TaxID=755169 RepID=UPI001D00172C|nr:UDP-3-O-(3-hydroxymyristoyl)glucosamine N-acyltransferase [Methylobacillus gramineus]MCB5184365.1 UDP-3-O-(3-hydroxymyristoyl)glucosamine N-acyltransferase [Methylobacillus gramineus]